MGENFAPIKVRIKQLPDILNVKKGIFYDKISSSAGNFRGKSLYSEISADVIEKISTVFPEVNLIWLITGRGGPLNSEMDEFRSTISEDESSYSKSQGQLREKERIISLLEQRLKDKDELLKVKDKYIERLESEIASVKGSNKRGRAAS